MSVRRPILRWHGGKWLLAPWIISHMPPHRVYVEPFGGAASVLLRKDRSQCEVYNDLDGEVVNLFRVLQSAPDQLGRLLDVTPYARSEFALAYEASDDPVERARRLLIRSHMGHGSNSHQHQTGFRGNGLRSGKLPQHNWQDMARVAADVASRFGGVVIEQRDAVDLIRLHDGPETLHYVDPPYVADTRDGGRDYAHEMTDMDHRRLLDALVSLEGGVMLSGYAHPLYDDALIGWRRLGRETLADGARPRTEVLWISPAAQVTGDLFTEAA